MLIALKNQSKSFLRCNRLARGILYVHSGDFHEPTQSDDAFLALVKPGFINQEKTERSPVEACFFNISAFTLKKIKQAMLNGKRCSR